MTDLDQSGRGFQRVRTYLGPSLGWVDEIVQPSTDIKVGGVYDVQPGDSLLLVDVAAGVTINLPDVVKWVQQPAYQPATAFDRSITIKDVGGNAANFNIVVVPFGQQTIDSIQNSGVIALARAVVKLVPLIDLTGWSIQTNQGGGGGGGGGGDVFKAGNNTFTGINTFQNIITVPTLPAGDNSPNAASTAYVQSHGYITGAALTPYALIASPIFTGDPRAPTPTAGDNDTSLATTAFVQAALASFSGGAPTGAEYITASANATLTAERVLTNTASITWDFSTPGQAKANTSAGGGNVSNSGTPVNGQIARWVTSTTIEGVDGSTLYAPINNPNFTGDPRAPTPPNADNDTSIATTAFVKSTSQPLDGDLTAISALGGTNTIYYRSGTDAWSPVTFSGLSFSGGVLTVTAGGGNVSNSGTPTAGQYAKWTSATVIQGVAASTVLSDAGGAPLASPTFTGDPKAPTPATADNDTSIATTAYVQAQSYLTTASAATVYAPLASPALTGNPTAPTASPGDNDTTIATTAFVTAAVAGASGATGFGPPQGRLTLLSGQPVMTGNITSVTVPFYTPYVGNQIPIYNGTTWAMKTFAEIAGGSINIAPAAAAFKNQDWFVWDNAGTMALTKGPDWTDEFTRSMTLIRINGIWLNSANITNGPAAQRGTYVGTTRTYLDVAVFLQWKYPGIAVGGLPGFFGVWNAYNRVRVAGRCIDNTASWTYANTGIQVRNAANNYIQFVTGLAEDSFSAENYQFSVNGTAGESAIIGLGLNGISTFIDMGAQGSNVAQGNSSATAIYKGLPIQGWNTIYALEACNATANAVTFFGQLTGPPFRYANELAWDFWM